MGARSTARVTANTHTPKAASTTPQSLHSHKDTEEAYLHRRELWKQLVDKITVDRDEYGRAEVHITYRFGPPPEESASLVDGVRNSGGIDRMCGGDE